ncbi:hypothetical protein [Leucobacter luti]|uniref:hypothetical protein n=1 Tax=Leucobacter luti TaxID=340320 RepID=UPI001C68CAA1|nr:hypothetical protein [Leucobacter luti]QYM75512.1 hypothetical protein K1X41_12910 [Leucobacter luti]
MPTPSKPEYLGEPTLGQVMRRPIWILALLCAFIVAGAFAWLGQWQMGIAVRSGDQVTVDTETPRTLAEVSDLAKGVTEDAAGVVVNVSGEFVPGDTRVVAPRDNAGKTGAWVVGHLITDPLSARTSPWRLGGHPARPRQSGRSSLSTQIRRSRCHATSRAGICRLKGRRSPVRATIRR